MYTTKGTCLMLKQAAVMLQREGKAVMGGKAAAVL